MKYAQITYTAHARLRMRERRISDQQIVDILENPDRTISRGDKRVVQQIMPRGRRLEVIFVEERLSTGVAARVITVIRRAGSTT
jgi:hypothetical protein